MRKKVLFVTENKLMPYRIPIFELVNQSENIELSVAHCGDFEESISFKQYTLKKRRFSKVTYFEDFTKLADGFDVILLMSYYHNISILKLLMKKKRKYNIILWGIGVRASYNHSFDSSSISNLLVRIFSKKADALLFYSDYPVKKYINYGINQSKLFVANNTVRVIKKENSFSEKNKFLFIGTLYKQKGLEDLILAYTDAYTEEPSINDLHIVGGGELDYYKEMIKEKNVTNKIIFHGPIYDEIILSELFDSSILCLSPKQAGLSVLKSMGYGVPFVTSSNAITGGERLNIVDGKTGFFVESILGIKQLILDSYKNPKKYLKVGANAYNYYWENRTPEMMANGILQAINYVLTKK